MITFYLNEKKKLRKNIRYMHVMDLYTAFVYTNV